MLVRGAGAAGGVMTQWIFGPEDYLVFGRESAGLPKALLAENAERCIEIPVLNPQARSLNLSNCVALVLYEALRQQGFDEVSS